MLKRLELPQKIEIVSGGIQSHACIIAHSDFAIGDVIYVTDDVMFFDKQTYQTIQVSPDVHLLDIVLAHLNHSCDPNTYIDCSTESPKLIAHKAITKGDELTFFYPSTELHMVQPFQCLCGSEHCIGLITGSTELSAESLMVHRLNDHVKKVVFA